MKTFKTPAEQAVGPALAQVFNACPDPLEAKLECFPKYARRQHLKRFLAMYEIFKLALPVKGSVVECGVFRGFGLMSWAKLSAILEPENLTRRIYGFDTFAGFPSLAGEDENANTSTATGDLRSNSYDELVQLIELYDQDRFLGHIPKVQLIKGDLVQTAPQFVKDHPHLVVSLLFIDCDLFEPTRAALKTFLPRMPRGAVLAFDELDNPQWPGETVALLEETGIKKLELRRLEWDPYIAYAVL
ncbi:MAG TPA: class I SAM-dependent methyltransferase [Opitutaceae bacterium]|nr:class I SAM-dependent methyltransferase [Opitutaceae bacterium]